MQLPFSSALNPHKVWGASTRVREATSALLELFVYIFQQCTGVSRT